MAPIYKLKSAGRREAWERDEDGWSWNPFARGMAKKRRAATDLETRENDNLRKPVHHNTAPELSTPPESSHQSRERTQTLPDDPEKTQVEGQEPLAESKITQSSDDKSEEEDDKYAGETKWKRRYRKMFKDDSIPAGQQIKHVLFPHWYTINWLLLMSPVGIGLHFVKGINPLIVFIVNFIAIVPLAGILSFATEEIALRVGEVLGGLLNASFGNAVELIVSIIALIKKEIIIVQTSLIGSILSNLLLVMGMCFYFGGLNREQQFFNQTVAQVAASLLALAVGALIIPTAYTWQEGFDKNTNKNDEQLSRGTSIILLVVYIAFLIFQLKSHREMYNRPSQKVQKRNTRSAKQMMARMGGVAGASSGGHVQKDARSVQDTPGEEDPEEPTLTFVGALITLLVATALIGVNAEFLVDSINEVTCRYHVSTVFVGLILLPIVGNAAEHATAVTVACKDKMDLAIGVAVGSSMQIALFVIPLSVLIGWWIGADMTLVFDNFQIAVLFVSVILVNYLIGDGASHWLEGLQLMMLYVIIAVAAWFYPQNDANSATCTG